MSEKALVPVSEVQTLARAVASSGLFQAFRNPEQAMVLMMMAQVEGCHPMQAVQRYDVIQGKPAKKSDAMLADFQQRGGTVKWTEYTDEAVEAEFMSKGMAAPCKVKWTYKQAQEAGLTNKPTWKQFKRQMLKARVISEGIRISDPGVVAGLYSPEEVQDFDVPPPSGRTAEAQPQRQVIDATVEPPPPSTNPTPFERGEPPVDEKIKNAKVKTLAIAIKAAGVPEAERKSWMSIKLNKDVQSSKDLSMDEIETLIGLANELKAASEAKGDAA